VCEPAPVPVDEWVERPEAPVLLRQKTSEFPHLISPGLIGLLRPIDQATRHLIGLGPEIGDPPTRLLGEESFAEYTEVVVELQPLCLI
jgi:hypothetical protein